MGLSYEFKNGLPKDVDDHTVWGLCMATIATGIPNLNEKTVNEFVRRSNVLKLFQNEVTAEKLKPFFGLTTNASSLTANQWAIQHFGKRREFK